MPGSCRGNNGIGIRHCYGLRTVRPDIVSGDQRVITAEPNPRTTAADDHIAFILVVDSITVCADSCATVRIELHTVVGVTNDLGTGPVGSDQVSRDDRARDGTATKAAENDAVDVTRDHITFACIVRTIAVRANYDSVLPVDQYTRVVANSE